MKEGTVKFFNNMKNYGFITGDDGKDYFVHVSGLKEGVNIKEGDRVSFEIVQGDRGLKAEEVEKIEEGAEGAEETEMEDIEEMEEPEESEVSDIEEA